MELGLAGSSLQWAHITGHVWYSQTAWLGGGEKGLSTTSQFSRFQQVPERNLKSDLLLVPAQARLRCRQGLEGYKSDTHSKVCGQQMSERLTMPFLPFGTMTIHTLSWALFAPCVDTLFCFPASLAFFPSLSFPPGRKCALYRDWACQGAALAPSMAVRWGLARA